MAQRRKLDLGTAELIFSEGLHAFAVWLVGVQRWKSACCGMLWLSEAGDERQGMI